MEKGKAKKRKSHHTVEEKLYAVKQVIYQNRHRMEVAIEMQISMGTMNNWLRRYQLEGTEGLHPKRDSKLKVNGKEEFERLRIIEKKYYEAQEDIEILKKFQASLGKNRAPVSKIIQFIHDNCMLEKLYLGTERLPGCGLVIFIGIFK